MPRRAATNNRHVRTRRDHATELAEDYVEAIDEVIEQNEVCRVKDLVARFKVTHVTVNRTLGRLQRDGLVKTQPYAPVWLTPKGKKLATESRERHEVVLRFLIAHGVSEATAEIDAEGLEHHLSEETLEMMKRFTAENE